MLKKLKIVVVTVYKFLAYITKNKFHKLQKYKYLEFLKCNVNIKVYL